LHAAAFAQTLAPWPVLFDYESIAGMKTRDAINLIVSQAGLELDEAQILQLVTQKQQCVRELIRDQLKPIEGVDKFLQWARNRYRLSLVTSGSIATVSLALQQLGLKDFFEPLICAEDVTFAKPDPEGFLKALQTTSILPEYALVFEDSDAGLAAAQHAGIACVDVRQVSWSDLCGVCV
jgi:HAD superfamily hydrolase (TIGR01509 family)